MNNLCLVSSERKIADSLLAGLLPVVDRFPKLKRRKLTRVCRKIVSCAYV